MHILHCPYGCRDNFATQQAGGTTRILCGTCWRIFVVEQRPPAALMGNDRIEAYMPYPTRIYEEYTGRPMTAEFTRIEIEHTPDGDHGYTHQRIG